MPAHQCSVLNELGFSIEYPVVLYRIHNTRIECRRALLATVTLACVAGCGGESAATNITATKVVNVYSWTDYIAPDVLTRFEAETGIKVNYDTYDSSYLVDTKLLAGRTGYDVLAHAGQNATRLIPLGVFAPIDPKRLPHWDEQDPDVIALASAYQGVTEHSVLYTWGSTGFAYNVDMVLARVPNAPLKSGALLFDPEIVSRLADCGVSYLDEPEDVIPLALAYLGRDPNSTSQLDVQAVEDLIGEVRPFIRYFSSTKMINDLPNEEVCVAMSYSGDYAQAAARATEVGRSLQLAYSVPLEGSRLWFDSLYIPSDAPNEKHAYQFIDFIMRPENIAEISNYIFYANGIATSKPMVRDELLNDPGIYPDAEVFERLFIALPVPPKASRLRNRAWARIKSGL